MKLKSLHLHGFKSFADRTELEFRDGVTAIIGSNGCGKSNIADAIRWVLGEQRASAIRGAKMEEAIFQGTARRRPLNFAEVTLVFDNESGRVPVPQREIEVARKVFREGGSEYSLNRNACRLRDVHDLLRDTGLGSNAYAIIEAGMIETLLSDRAEERRLLFEEAAGIGRYKDSRHSALRRLESAEADLERLGDLIAEVDSKVRSLSRQRRKAERHQELRERRLQLEVAVARHELTGVSEALHDAERRMAELDEEQRSAAAERSAAETRVESARVEAAELARGRGEIAARLEAVRRELDAREREVLLAQERRAHADMRLEQLAAERREVIGRLESLAGEAERIRSERTEREAALRAVRDEASGSTAEAQRLREALVAERAETESRAARGSELAREIASAEGERSSAERRRAESGEQAARLTAEDARLARELEDLTSQTALWSSRADELRAELDDAAASASSSAARVELAAERERAAREAARAAEDALSRLSGQVEAREALERSYEGFPAAVAALMGLTPLIPGVRGPLVDFLPGAAPEIPAAAAEAVLGPLLQAVVVDDLAVARAVREWFRDRWSGAGTLLLLPLDALSTRADSGAWASALLADVVVVSDDPLRAHTPGVPRVNVAGEMMDARGVVKLVDAASGSGIIARREELIALKAQREEAEARAGAAVEELRDAREALSIAEAAAREAEERRAAVEAELRRVEMDSASHEHSTGRLARDRSSVSQKLEAARAAGAEAGGRIAALEERLAELGSAVGEAAAAEEAMRERLSGLEARWETARERESEMRVAVARAEADLAEASRRDAETERDRASRQARISAIDEEGARLRETLEGLSGVRQRAGSEIEQLFAARDEETGRLAMLDSRLSEVDSELAELGERVRHARRHEQESGEEKHRMELAAADARSRVERVRERLEVEWGRPWDTLVASTSPLTEGEPDDWRDELRRVVSSLDGLGPVNMLALEEHEEESRRLEFLTDQRDDLVAAREDLVAAIRQINRTARELFLTTFESVRENFRRVFQSLFEGGECDMRLADPDDPLESLVEIQASPKGKRTQRIHLLSGGERTLTALALLFALYLEKPSPFCVLDELDAPLDESNIGRFIQLLQDFKSDTQFIVITHHPRTMEAADWVYGVTMEEPGVSSIVGVELVGDWTAGNRVA